MQNRARQAALHCVLEQDTLIPAGLTQEEGGQWLSGRVLDSYRGAAGSSLTGVTAVCP